MALRKSVRTTPWVIEGIRHRVHNSPLVRDSVSMRSIQTMANSGCPAEYQCGTRLPTGSFARFSGDCVGSGLFSGGGQTKPLRSYGRTNVAVARDNRIFQMLSETSCCLIQRRLWWSLIYRYGDPFLSHSCRPRILVLSSQTVSCPMVEQSSFSLRCIVNRSAFCKRIPILLPSQPDRAAPDTTLDRQRAVFQSRCLLVGRPLISSCSCRGVQTRLCWRQRVALLSSGRHNNRLFDFCISLSSRFFFVDG